MDRTSGYEPLNAGSIPAIHTFFETLIWGCSGFDWGLKVINSHEMICALCNQNFINLNDKKIVKLSSRKNHTAKLALAA